MINQHNNFSIILNQQILNQFLKSVWHHICWQVRCHEKTEWLYQEGPSSQNPCLHHRQPERWYAKTVWQGKEEKGVDKESAGFAQENPGFKYSASSKTLTTLISGGPPGGQLWPTRIDKTPRKAQPGWFPEIPSNEGLFLKRFPFVNL